MTQTANNCGEQSDDLRTLGRLAFLANRLAKNLSGPDRAIAYRIKSEALSALVVNGIATVNGYRPNNTLGLDFFDSRLHCPLSSLTAHAQSVIRQQAGSFSRTAPMADLLSPSGRTALKDAVRQCAGQDRS
jgi:hypothetical protein